MRYKVDHIGSPAHVHDIVSSQYTSEPIPTNIASLYSRSTDENQNQNQNNQETVQPESKSKEGKELPSAQR